MDLNDIQISEITQQYLDYLHAMQELNLEMAGEFLVMAATLLHLKTKVLLPTPESENEEEDAEYPVATTDELVQQLIEYRRFKEVSALLREREEEMSHIHFREKGAIQEIVPQPQELTCDVSLLLKAFARVISVIETPDYNPEIHEPFTVELKIDYMERLCMLSPNVNLEEVFRHCFNRVEVVVTFLAILELTRMKKIRITQVSQFEPITLNFIPEEDREPDQNEMLINTTDTE